MGIDQRSLSTRSLTFSTQKVERDSADPVHCNRTVAHEFLNWRELSESVAESMSAVQHRALIKRRTDGDFLSALGWSSSVNFTAANSQTSGTRFFRFLRPSAEWLHPL